MDIQDQNSTAVPYNFTSFSGGNYTIDNNNNLRTENDEESTAYKEVEIFVWIMIVLAYLAALLSIVTCVLAFISWIKIPQWRTFKNFIYLNLIFCYAVLYFFAMSPNSCSITSLICPYVPALFMDSFICWLFIASVVSYMDIVKVFSVNVTRKRLKCSLFAWGMPASIILLSIIVDYLGPAIYQLIVIVIFTSCFIPIILLSNLFIYIKVLYSLFKVARCINNTRYKQKVQVATFTFFMSGSMMLPVIVIPFFPCVSKSKCFLHEFIIYILIIVQTIIINVCFLMLKSNRNIWRQHCCNKSCCLFSCGVREERPTSETKS